MDTINTQRSFVKYMETGLSALGIPVQWTEVVPDEKHEKYKVNHVNIAFATEGKSPYAAIKDFQFTEVVIDVIHNKATTAATWRDAVMELLKVGVADYYEFTKEHPAGVPNGWVITWESDEFDYTPFGDDLIVRHSGSVQIHFRK